MTTHSKTQVALFYVSGVLLGLGYGTGWLHQYCRYPAIVGMAFMLVSGLLGLTAALMLTKKRESR